MPYLGNVGRTAGDLNYHRHSAIPTHQTSIALTESVSLEACSAFSRGESHCIMSLPSITLSVKAMGMRRHKTCAEAGWTTSKESLCVKRLRTSVRGCTSSCRTPSFLRFSSSAATIALQCLQREATGLCFLSRTGCSTHHRLTLSCYE